MQPQSNDYSYFLTSESDLESLAEDYFSTRPVDEQDEQEDNYYPDFSSNETDSDVDLDFSECDTSELSGVQAFVTKTSVCAHGDKETPSSSTIQIEDIIACRNNCRERPKLP